MSGETVSSANLTKNGNYEIFRKGHSQGIGKFTGEREGILGIPIFDMGNVKKGYSPTIHTYKKVLRGGQRASTRKTRKTHRRSTRRN